MADNVTFNSTGSAPPSGTVVWTDELSSAGGSTRHTQVIRIAPGGLGSTTVVSSANPLPVISTTVLVVSGSVSIGSGTVSVTPLAGSTFVVVPGSSFNTTAIISTASKIQAELVTGFGAGSSNPIINRHFAPVSESTWATITLTSTTATTLFSSGGSTRVNITDLQITVNSTANPAEVSIYDNTTGGTLLYRGTFGPEGGISAVFSTPRRGSSGEKIQAQMLPTGSTVTISAGGFRSS